MGGFVYGVVLILQVNYSGALAIPMASLDACKSAVEAMPRVNSGGRVQSAYCLDTATGQIGLLQ